MAELRSYIRRYRVKAAARPGSIILVLLSEIDRPLVDALQAELEIIFSKPVEIRKKVKNLDRAYDDERGQYNSPVLLSELRRMEKARFDKILGVVDVDLYSPGFEFVYGEADTGCGVATLSIYRFQVVARASVSESVTKRTVKEAVHELGHLFGLGHCANTGCVMRFSASLAKVDKKQKSFCLICRQQLETFST